MRLVPSSITVFLRSIRPYQKYFFFLFWIYIRLIHREREVNSSNSVAKFSIVEIQSRNASLSSHGLLDYLQSILVVILSTSIQHSSKLLAHIDSDYIFSTLYIYLNDFLGILLIFSLLQFIQSILKLSLDEVKNNFILSVLEFAKNNINFVREKYLEEEEKMRKSLREMLQKSERKSIKVLPKKGVDTISLFEDLKSGADSENKRWENGLVSGTVYGGERHHVEFLNKVYALYSLSNPLHPDVWPRINQCEAEVISMTANLMNGGDMGVVGSMTCGGTESIILAVRAHLQIYGKKRGIKYPEIISGNTAHAGLDKACEMFGIRLVQITCNESNNFQLQPEEVERRMNMNVIMIYASAPGYPQGVIDPIDGLSNISLKYDVGLHVDCCLGGFILPFAKTMDYNVPKFDFSCQGVTSMSADTHKYGYTCKGSSVVLYRNRNLRSAQYFCYAKWTGGLYSTPTIAGSRAGGIIAQTWASLVAIGEEGFKSRAQLIMDTTREIAKGVSEINGLKLLGCDPSPHAMIVCFASAEGYNLDIYQVAEMMAKDNWSLNSLQLPAAIHLCVTLRTVEHKEKFIRDLKRAVKKLLLNPVDKKEGGSAAIYGATGNMPAGPVNEILKLYTDVTLSC